jgi:TonB family protein
MRRALVTGSVVAHAAALTALLVASWWRIDRVAMPTSTATAVTVIAPGASGARAPRATPKPSPRRAVAAPSVQARVAVAPRSQVTQPRPRRAAVAPAPIAAVPVPEVAAMVASDLDDGAVDAAGAGVGERDGDREGSGEAGRQGDGGDGGGTHVLRRADAAALKIAGLEQIDAPLQVKQEMLEDGLRRTRATIKLCVDPDGFVAIATVLGSTGYPAYDRRLVDEMSRWQYRPLVVDGRAVPFCTVINLLYLLR